MEMAKVVAEMQKKRPDRISTQIRFELLEYYSLDAYSERLGSFFETVRQNIGLYFHI